MLFVLGIACLALGAVIAASGAVVFQNRLGSRALRALIGSEVLSVFLAVLAGSGLLMVMMFVIEFETQSFGLLEAVLSVAAAIAGVVGVRIGARLEKAPARPSHLPPGHPA